MIVRPAEPSSAGATVLVTKHAYSSDVSAVECWQATTAVDGRIEGAAMDAFGQARRQWVKSRSTSDHKITDFTRDAPGHVIARTVYQETLSSTSTPPAGTPGGASTTAYDWGLMRAYSDGNWSENHISSTELLRQVRRPDPTSGSPVSDSARFFAYNAPGEARALWTRRGASAVVGREAVYDPLGRKTSEVVRADYEAGSNALEWDYDLFDRITAARSLDGATPAAVLNEVTTSFGPYGEIAAVRQEHDGSVSASTSPFATAVYTGPGTAYGLRRPTNQYFNKTSGGATAAEAEIAYDYGTAGAIDDMLTRPVRQRYFQYPYAAASEFRVDEYYMGARAWVRSQSRQGSPSFSLKLTQEIPDYKLVSGGLDRFGRTVLFKAWKDLKTWPLRRTWQYDATTGLLTAKRDYMKKTTRPEFALAAWDNTYDDFSRTTDVDYDYAQDTGPSWQWVDQELDDAHWLYDGADGITHFSGDNATAYPSRTLNRREEIATIDSAPAVVLYTEAGEVRYQDYPLHGVADKYYFFDAWGRMCGHGTAIDPNEPPKPATELEVYVTYDALGRVIVRTEVENEVPIPLHYYYDLQGNRAWEGPDAETVARVHFHSLYSGRNFALMGSAYYVVDPGDGAAMLCNSDGSFKQVLSTYPTGEPHPITVYGAQEVDALLAGQEIWDAKAKAVGSVGGSWFSTPLYAVLCALPCSTCEDYKKKIETIDGWRQVFAEMRKKCGVEIICDPTGGEFPGLGGYCEMVRTPSGKRACNLHVNCSKVTGWQSFETTIAHEFSHCSGQCNALGYDTGTPLPVYHTVGGKQDAWKYNCESVLCSEIRAYYHSRPRNPVERDDPNVKTLILKATVDSASQADPPVCRWWCEDNNVTGDACKAKLTTAARDLYDRCSNSWPWPGGKNPWGQGVETVNT